MPPWSPMRSRDTLIPKVTISPMVSILLETYLGRQSANLKTRNIVGLLKSKRRSIWSEHLVCSNLLGILFSIMPRHGAGSRCGRSWLVVLSCTTWLLRRSAMTMCMAKGENINLNWLPPSRTTARLHRFFFTCIMNFKTVQLTTDSKEFCSPYVKSCWKPPVLFLFILFEFKVL
jgi:hypothetical protein